MGRWLKKLSIVFVLVAGCSQSVNKVNVTPKNPVTPGTLESITTTDVQGATTVTPMSASRTMVNHALGGTAVRTTSSSVSFRMTSGVAVD